MRERLLAGGLLWLLQTSVAAQVLNLEVQTPRSFGYVIGDTIVFEVGLTLARPFKLAPDSLPAVGPLSPVLELGAPIVRHRGRSYRITLVYQLIGRPADAQRLVIPGHALLITDGERELPVRIPEWSFQMTSLVAVHEMDRVSVSMLRPDRPPPTLALTGHVRRLIWIGLGLLTAIGIVLYSSFGRPWLTRRRRPFTAALRRLRRLEQQAWTTRNQREALRIVHGAFNATAGHAVFASGLEDLMREQPGFGQLRGLIETFYRQSRRTFFEADAELTAPAGQPRLAPLIALCRRCRDIERGAR